MRISRLNMSRIYFTLGLCAWLLTSLHLPTYLPLGLIDGTAAFWRDALIQANPAGKFLSVDILFLAFAVIVWMLSEARRHDIRGIGLYILLGIFVGISLAVPLFLAARERHLAIREPDTAWHEATASDLLWMVFVGTGTLVCVILTFWP